MGAGALVLILFLKRWPRVPGILIAVVAATVAVARLTCGARRRVRLGPLPQGLPSPTLAVDRRCRSLTVSQGGLAVALVSFADTSVLSRTYAARLRTPVDPNQEMVGLGAANLAAGFFQGFPISSSSSRTPVAEAAGARTQMTGVVGALAIALLLLFAPNLLQHLPKTALAAVVIASAIGLFEFATCVASTASSAGSSGCRSSASRALRCSAPFRASCSPIVIAVIEFLWDGWRPHSAVLGRVEQVKG